MTRRTHTLTHTPPLMHTHTLAFTPPDTHTQNAGSITHIIGKSHTLISPCAGVLVIILIAAFAVVVVCWFNRSLQPAHQPPTLPPRNPSRHLNATTTGFWLWFMGLSWGINRFRVSRFPKESRGGKREFPLWPLGTGLVSA